MADIIEKENAFKEKRHPVLCANCGMQMVCMNKYVVLKNDRQFYVWYICPRRKESDEKGCGHKSPIAAKRIREDKGSKLVSGYRLVGEVRLTDKVAMIIQDNLETFGTWLHHHREKFRDKRVEIAIRIIEKGEA